MRLRTDLAVEAREIAGENIGGVDFDTYSENGMEISRLTVRTERARLALGKEEGTYVTSARRKAPMSRLSLNR